MTERLAHVSYVLTDAEQASQAGADFSFIAEPLLNPVNLGLIIGAITLAGASIVASHKVPFLRDRVRYFRGRARSYQEFIPWILRFSLGIALVGAGSQQALISPAVSNQPAFATIQLILGFLLVAGLALTPVTLCALALSIGALIMHPELVDNLEIIAALVAFLLLGQAKPGLDDLFGIAMPSFSEKVRSLIPLILRLGLGSSFIIMAVTDKLLNPHLFGAVVDMYGLTRYVPVSIGMWVTSATIIELILGVAILIGLQTRLMSIVAFLVLSLSFFFFGEDVYAHVTIFGVLFVLIITGGGTYSLDDIYTKRRQRA